MADINRRGHLSLSDEVYNYLAIRISEGVWREGDKMPSESQLCKLCNVSRVSVRSAIQKLQGQGLIATMQGVGSFVCSPMNEETKISTVPGSDITSSAFLRFFEFRQAIEFKAIDLFTIRGTKEEMTYLKEILGKMKDCGNEERKKYADLDMEFHMTILKGAKNSFLYNAMEPYKSVYYHYLEEIVRLSPKTLAELSEEHERLYMAIESKKPSLAKEFLLSDNTFYHFTIFSKITEE